MQEREARRALGDRILRDRILRGWGFASALFVGANLLALPLIETRSLADEPEYVSFVDAGIRAAYPDWKEPERRRLRWETRFMGMGKEALILPREQAYQGEHVNVSEHGFRHVRDQGPWPPSRDHYNLFFFGGSAGFGYHVRDEDTVASRLQEALGKREGRSVRVYNFARGGYAAEHQRLALSRLLALGHAPDMAVHLDGMNEFATGGGGPLLARVHTQPYQDDLRHPLRAWLAALPIVRALPARSAGLFGDAGRPVDALSAAEERERYDDADRDRRIIHHYFANMVATRTLGDVHGVESLFVWQPVPTYGYDLEHHANRGSFKNHTYSRYGYPRMAQRVRKGRTSPHFVWCADLQRGPRGAALRGSRALQPEAVAARGAVHRRCHHERQASPAATARSSEERRQLLNVRRITARGGAIVLDCRGGAHLRAQRRGRT